MSEPMDLQPVQSAVSKSRNILIAITKNPDHDTVAAALALYLSLKENKKSVDIVCSTLMVVEHSRLVGLDKVKAKIGNKNLVVSLKYIKDSIEKVSYNVEGDRFNLVIQPKEGSKPLDTSGVAYSYSGMNADTIFIFGASSYLDLTSLYEINKKSFEKAFTISINRILKTPFAQSTITDQRSGSVSEITTWLIEQLGYQPSADIASNLLSGVDRATNKFSSPNTPASSFLTAGKLIQLGATRFAPPPRSKSPSIPSMSRLSVDASTAPLPTTTSPLLKPMSVADSQKISPEINDENSQKTTQNPGKPKDWYEPKIYRGSTKV